MHPDLESGSQELEAEPSRLRSLLAGIAAGRMAIAWALLIGVSPAYSLFALVRGNVDYLIDNSKLGVQERLLALGALLASVLLMGSGFWLYRRRRRRLLGEAALASLAAWNRRTFWLLALPWIPILFVPKVESHSPWLVIFAAAMIAATLVAAVYRSGFLALSEEGGKRWGRLVGTSLLGGLTAAYAGLFSFYAIRHHHALGTRTYDLGIYDNIFWHTSHGNLLGSSLIRSGSHISAHFDPILILLSPLYRLYPKAEFLLVLQSFWLALGAIPLFLLARKKLGSPWLALSLALVYLLYPALHGANMYDFHSLALAGPLLIAALAALELGRIRVFALFVGLLLLTREDLSLVVAGIGVYAIFALGRRRLGLITVASAVIYLISVKLFVMPDPGLFMQNTKETYGYAYYYKDLIPFSGEGSAGLVTSLLVNPLFVVQHLATEPKLQYFFLLFLPILFLPLLFGGRRNLALAYGFAFLFLSSRTAVHSIHFQYSTVLAPLAIAMVPVILAELPRRRWVSMLGLDGARLVPALGIGMLAATLALSAKFGGILPNTSFRAGFSSVDWAPSQVKKEMYAWIQTSTESIPPQASVSATKRLGPHVSNRRDSFVFPVEAEYLFVHRGDLGEKGRKQLDELAKKHGYGVVSSFREAALWKKGEKPVVGKGGKAAPGEGREKALPVRGSPFNGKAAPIVAPGPLPANLRLKAAPRKPEGSLGGGRVEPAAAP